MPKSNRPDHIVRIHKAKELFIKNKSTNKSNWTMASHYTIETWNGSDVRATSETYPVKTAKEMAFGMANDLKGTVKIIDESGKKVKVSVIEN